MPKQTKTVVPTEKYRYRVEKTQEDILIWKYNTYTKEWIVFQRLLGALVKNFKSIKTE